MNLVIYVARYTSSCSVSLLTCGAGYFSSPVDCIWTTIIFCFCFYGLFLAVIQRPHVDIRTPSYSSMNESSDLRCTVYKTVC